ncbi:AMP-binding protein [Blastococcus sp. SYSU DS0533]
MPLAPEYAAQQPGSDAGWFWGGAERAPDRIAVVDVDGRQWAAGEFGERVNQLSHALRAAGAGRAESIVVASRNSADYLALELAAGQIGVYLVPTGVHQTRREFAHVIGDSGARLVFVDDDSAAAAVPAAADCGLPGERVVGLPAAQGARPLAELLVDMPTGRPEGRVAGRYMYYTAGTTGSPKGVVVPATDLSPEEDADGWVPTFATGFDFVPFDGVHLVTGPLYHRGPGIWALVSLHLGHTVVLMRRFDPETMLELIARYRVTSTHIVPTVFHRMLQLPEERRARYDTSSLRQVLHAAAPCPVHVKRRMIEWFGPVLWEYYGSTEGGGTMVRPEEFEDHPGSVGRPWPGARVRITDDQRSELPSGHEGTIWISNGTRFHYRGDEGKTAAAWDGEWFTVGDVGHLDEDGWLFIGDRRSDLIISGGVNVYPAEVEGVLLAHPLVADAAVVGLPDDEWGERVTAVVEPRPEVTEPAALEADLLAHCRRELAGPKVPRRLAFVDALPRNEIGKVSRRGLREALLGATRGAAR